MASSMISSVAPVTRATAAQASMVVPFTGLKSIASFPVTRKLDNDITSVASNGGRVQCMKVYFVRVGTIAFVLERYNVTITTQEGYFILRNTHSSQK